MKIYSLIPKVMADVGAIGKNGVNTYDDYKFRSIDDVYNGLQPALAKNGVFFVPEVIESIEQQFTSQKGTPQIRVKQKIKYTFYADDGSSFCTVVEGEAIDRSDKATNKAMTAALKYMLIQVFCIAVSGMDDADSETNELSGDNNTKNDNGADKGAGSRAKTNPLEYVVTIGKNKGKRFSDIPEKTRKDLYDYLIKSGKEKPLTGGGAEYVNVYEHYLDSVNSVDREPQFDKDEKIPF